MKSIIRYIIEYHKSLSNINYEDEINRIWILKDYYIDKLEKNKMRKSEREDLILLLKLL